ncbi:Porin, Gram-negative type [gamma proteobacterium HdN1]|nr:Porin, Gram-negative type [gamma proteobacterium HdN1]
MKVKLLPIAITAALAVPNIALAAGPTISGRLNVSFDNVKYDFGYDPTLEYAPGDAGYGRDASSRNWQLNSNSSRFGIKGDAEINSALKATYFIEWGIDVTDGNSSLVNRNRYVGLAGNFGAVDAGQIDTPTKVAQGKVDVFNDFAGDLMYIMVGDVRATNIIQYTSPTMSGVQAKLAVMPGEEWDDGTGNKAEDGPVDSFAASVTYSEGPIWAAISHDNKVKANAFTGVDINGSGSSAYALDKDAGIFNTSRLVGQYTTDQFSVGALYERAELQKSVGKWDADALLVSGAYNINKTVVKAQIIYGVAKDQDSDELKSLSWSLGIDEKLSAQTTVGGYYTALSYEWDTSGSEKQKRDVIGVYLAHNF